MLIEDNVVIKDPRKVDLRFASCYPNLYKSAMSSLGFHIIYDFLNTREDVYCERVVYPYFRSLESNTALKDFDMISFSLQYEQDYFKVIEMLNKSLLSISKKNRGPNDPLIIAGGPCASSNPLPMSKFIDLFIVGEAEVILDKVLDMVLALDDPRKEIDDFLDIKGVFVPDHPVKLAVVENMDQAHHPIRQVVPKTDDKRFIPAFGKAFLLGVSRGCSRSCRFCMAGCIYRPRRETSLKKLFKIAEMGRHATGLEKIALIGASASDYSKIEDLCEGLIDRDFRITTPSLRIESISYRLLDNLSKSGLKTISIAPESTWRIRKVLNKPVTDKKIIEIIKIISELSMNVKLYFLVGAPTEKLEDIKDLVNFIRDMNKIFNKKNKLRISINPFIPKPHTPFQWEKFDFEAVKSKKEYLIQKLKIPFKIESIKSSLIQYVLSNGDSSLGKIIEEAWKKKLSLKEWQKLAQSRNLDEDFPWRNIDVNMKPGFLKKEYMKALDGEITSWCEDSGCNNCGACISSS
jgi:radical SAM superfamily enzyme YgiQ (UPF0313 family)